MKKIILALAICLSPINGYAAQTTLDEAVDQTLDGTAGDATGEDMRLTLFGNMEALNDMLTELYGFFGAGSDGVYGISLNNNTTTFAPQVGYDGGFSLVANHPVSYFSGAVHKLQLWDTDLDTYATLSPSANFQVLSGHTFSQMRDDLDLEPGVDVQPLVASTVDGSTAGSLSAAQVAGTIIRNYGQATADVALVLPTAAAGYNALFVVGTAQSNKWGVQAGTNDKIYLLASDGTISVGSDNGYARMTEAQVGQSFACWTFQSSASAWDWMCKAGSIGTSTFAAN